MPVLCQWHEIEEGQGKGFEVEGHKLLAVKYRDQLYVYLNSCPHRSIPLEWQPDQFLDYDRTFIQCATHGALFNIETGLCVSGPCVDDHLSAIEFEREGDQIIIASL